MSEYDAIAGARDVLYAELLRQRLIKTYFVASPGAGSDWSTVVPAGAVWELLLVHERLIASAVVATRTARIQVRDSDGNTLSDFTSGVSHTASGNIPYTFAAGEGNIVQGSSATPPLPSPPMLVPGGLTVRSLTTNLDAGDAYSEISLQVREWSLPLVQQAANWYRGRL